MIFHYNSNTYIKVVVQQREGDFSVESGLRIYKAVFQLGPI